MPPSLLDPIPNTNAWPSCAYSTHAHHADPPTPVRRECLDMWHRRNQTCPMCRTPTQGTLGAKTVDSFLKAMLEDVLERDDWLAYERRCEEADARAQQAKAAREQSGRKRTRDGAPHQANGLTRVGGAARGGAGAAQRQVPSGRSNPFNDRNQRASGRPAVPHAAQGLVFVPSFTQSLRYAGPQP